MSDGTSELEFEDADDDGEIAPPNAYTPMIFSPMQRPVKDLHSDFTSGDLDPQPAFQRGYVWDKPRASKLIESILLNVPLPLVYTAEEADQTEVVIDGQQRLVSVFKFIEGKFPRDGSKFKLTGLKLLSDLNGKTFAELDPAQQRAIRKYTFQIIRISKDSHADVKFEIFERLNSGSVTLNAQELRNCVYRGKLNTVLRNLSANSDFRAMIGTNTVTSRMQDQELVLRFLTFVDKTYLNYSGSMKSFLNDYMNENRNPSDEKVAKLSDMFKKASSQAFSVFGTDAFKKYSIGNNNNPNGSWERQINRPLFDVVMWGFTRYEKHQTIHRAEEIREALIELLATDVKFLDSVTAAVGDKAKTNYRFVKWNEMLESIIPKDVSPRVFPASVKERLYAVMPVCALCKQKIMTIEDSHVDHITPFSQGGETKEENAQLTHRFCNLQKSGKIA